MDMNAHQSSENMFHARRRSLATLSSTTRCGKEGVDDSRLLELLLVGSEGEEQVERGDRIELSSCASPLQIASECRHL